MAARHRFNTASHNRSGCEHHRLDLSAKALPRHQMIDGFERRTSNTTKSPALVDRREWEGPSYQTCRNAASEEDPGDAAQNGEVNWPPFRPDTRHNLEGLRLSSSTGLCLTTTNVSN